MFSPLTSLLMSMNCHNQYKVFQSDILEYKMKVSLQIFCLAQAEFIPNLFSDLLNANKIGFVSTVF